MFRSLSAERGPPNHPGNGSLLHGPGRLRDFHARLRDFHRAARARVFPRRTPRDSSMAVSAGHTTWVNWRFWCCLVSTRMEVGTHRASRVVHRIYRHILLGALWHPRETAVPGAWLDSQLRSDQLDHLGPVASAHARVWKNWHSASHRIARKPHSDHLRRELHYARARPLLCSNPRDWRSARPIASA